MTDRYEVFYSPEDGEWVAIATARPSCSWIDTNALTALAGLINLEAMTDKDTP